MDAHSLHSDDVLQERASQGDEKAFKALFDRYHVRLFRYVLTIVKSREVAEELVMDVFLKLWLARDLIPQIDNLDGFLFRVAYNKTVDFFRAAAKEKRFTELLWEQIQDSSSLAADTALSMHEYETRLREAIELLPPQRRKIFELSREEGLSHSRIAEELGISKSTVANTIVEARQFIQAYLVRHLELSVLLAVLSHLFKNK